ncbi:MAG: FecR domain-containing protein [Dongiaceae bacterium]
MPYALRTVILLFLAVAAAGVLSTRAQAEDGILTWIVRSISSDDEGDIVAVSAMQVPQVGTALASGQRISTGTGQHMIIVNGRDLIAVSTNTTIAIGDNDPATSNANVDLVSGTIHVEVGKRAPGQTFSIEAPYLVATVKGTQFDVSTSMDASAVTVTEGVVAVSAIATGKSVDVTAGNTAIVARRTVGAPTLAPSPVGGAASTIGIDSGIGTTTPDDSGSGSGNSGSGSSGGSSADSGSGESDGLGDAVGGATGAVGDAVGGVSGAVGGAVSGVGGAVGGAVTGVGGAVEGAVGGLGGAVGGALGGKR